ncbi:MAG TPA: helix-turn-helix domain-containing protein [Thermomicrobiales bacterium]|nr:helix-turn-helix domain-containing protein [Thermomicrobiales bacterium]
MGDVPEIERSEPDAPFGARLRAARVAVGLTQETLAERAGLTPNGVGALERGEHRHPYPATIRALAEALGLTDDERAALATSVPKRGSIPTLTEAPALARNVPASLSPLIGRAAEATAIAALLRRDDVRLVTLTGPGGVGKTRLALQVALGSSAEFADGVAFVPLAAVRDPDLVAVTIAQALGLVEAGGRSPVDRLADALRDRALLLILDNLEHLLDAAPLVTELLTRCPCLVVLATSRTTLRLSGEHDVPVSPLALPDPQRCDDLTHVREAAAIQLFLQRAQAIDPTFALTAENAAAVAGICERLDGLPLAIELAATWSRVFPPAALLPRLARRLPLLTGGRRDAPDRHQTMRDAIAWSHDLLAASQQDLFRRLGVFVGGVSLEAAGVVAEDVEVPVLDCVAALVDHHLLERANLPNEDASAGAPRFVMLETVREFALEQLEASGAEVNIRRRHATHFLALVERAAPRLWSHDQLVWLSRLETDHDNLRTALRWSCDQPHGAERAARLALALAWFWYLHGHMAEGRRWLEELLAAPGVLTATARARALVGAGLLAYGRGDLSGATDRLAEGLELARGAEDGAAWTRAAAFLGFTLRDRGAYDRAAALFAESLLIAKRSGDRWGIGFATYLHSTAARELGDLEGEARFAEECLPLLREQGERLGIAYALEAIGWVAVTNRDDARALAAFSEFLAVSREVGNLRGISFALYGLAAVARLRGEHDIAAASVMESLPLWRRLGNDWGNALALEELAAIAAACGEATRAARLAGAAAALRESIGSPLSPRLLAIHEGDLAPARSALGETAFAAARDEGRTLQLDDAIGEGKIFAAELAARVAGDAHID